VLSDWDVPVKEVLPLSVGDLDRAQSGHLGLIASGHSVPQTPRELHVSERTTTRLTAALLRSLRVSSRAEAASLAGRFGLLDD